MNDERLTKLQTMAQRFGENGSVDQATMRKINALASSSQLGELSDETQQAIHELEAGKGKRFESLDDLMADLNADD